MATNEKRRQKKLERKKQQRKQRQGALAKAKSRSLAGQMTDSSRYPVLHARYQETLFSSGIGHLMISRQLPDGRVAVGVFLLDMYCLGVKNAFGTVVTPGDYQDRFVDSDAIRDAVDAPPEEIRKLVEEGVAYAEYCGFPPHTDYRRVRPIFGDIDAGKCERDFQFGLEGVPRYIQGPHESPERVRQILAELHERFGPDGYHYVLAAGPPGDLPFND